VLLLTGKQAKNVDNYTQDKIGIPGLVLMERAALSVAERVEQLIKADREIYAGAENKNSFIFRKAKVVAVAGMGNNGGDAVAAARILHQRGIDASVILVGSIDRATESMKKQIYVAEQLFVNIIHLEKDKVSDDNVSTENAVSDVSDKIGYAEFRKIVKDADIIIDGLFGIGLSRDIEGVYKDVIDIINGVSAYKIAVDIPSGIDCDSGKVKGTAVKCDETVTFSFMKYGIAIDEGREYAGKITISEIGLEMPVGEYNDEVIYRAIPAKQIKTLIPTRSQNSNKGTYGKVLIVAGNDEIYGAAYLSAAAAYKTGAGLVKIFTADVNKDNLMRMLPEAMIASYRYENELSDTDRQKLRDAVLWADVIAIGPGLGTDFKARSILKEVVAFGEKNKYLIMDADAINICSSMDETGIGGTALLKDASKNYEGHVIITPHIAEMRRLLGRIEEEDVPLKMSDNISCVSEETDVSETECCPEKLKTESWRARDAYYVSSRYNITVVLKDARTHIASPGIGKLIYVNVTGNSGMSKGGSGDVLTGIIAATVAGLKKSGTNKRYFAQTIATAVALHGAAGDAAKEAKGEYGMLAGDIIDALERILYL
jgi:yjeF N-terminal region